MLSANCASVNHMKRRPLSHNHNAKAVLSPAHPIWNDPSPRNGMLRSGHNQVTKACVVHPMKGKVTNNLAAILAEAEARVVVDNINHNVSQAHLQLPKGSRLRGITHHHPSALPLNVPAVPSARRRGMADSLETAAV